MKQKFENRYACKCEICNHQWLSRNDEVPRRCANVKCQSFKWDRGEIELKTNGKTMPEEILDDDFFKQTPEEIEEVLQMRSRPPYDEDIEENRKLIETVRKNLKPIIEQPKPVEKPKEYYSTKGKKERPVKIDMDGLADRITERKRAARGE